MRRGNRQLQSLWLAAASSVLLAALAEFETFELPNGIIFDAAVNTVAGGAPRALIVRATAGTEARTEQALKNRGLSTERMESLYIMDPSFGISRKIVLPGRGPHLVGLPASAVMPVMTAEQLLSGSFSDEELKGLVTLLAPSLERDPPRLLVSAVGNPSQITAADFLARALHAQRTGQLVSEVTGLTRLLLLLVTSALLLLFAQWFRPRAVPLATAVSAAVVLLLGIASVRAAGLLLPATEILLLCVIAGAAVMIKARAARESRLTVIADRAGGFASRHSLLTDQRRWVDFFPAAMRLTGVEAGLLLEEQPDGSFAARAAMSNGSSSAPSFVERSPAFDHADTVRPELVPAEGLDGWTGAWVARLDRSADCPLYWLFRVDPGKTNLVLPAARRLAGRVAELPLLSSPARRVAKQEDVDVRLFASLSSMLTRSSEQRRLLGSLQTATMLFDGAGIPLQVNGAMERLLRAVRLNPAKVTPVDVASTLGGLGTEGVRGMLEELIRHGGDIRLHPTAEVAGRRYGLRITEIEGDLLLEASDVTDLRRLADLQRELAGDIDARVRNDLEAIDLASRLASDDRLPAERRTRALAMIGEAAARTRGTLDNLARLVDASVYSSASGPYPVNPRSALIQATGALKTISDHRGVRIDLHQPALASLVLAEPRMLDELVRAMLLVPISDSQRGGVVTARLTEAGQFTELLVTGGFGLPAERFVQAISGALDTAEPLRMLGEARSIIKAWGAELNATSEAGQGYFLTLRLRKDE